jgi:hypothetical protein
MSFVSIRDAMPFAARVSFEDSARAFAEKEPVWIQNVSPTGFGAEAGFWAVSVFLTGAAVFPFLTAGGAFGEGGTGAGSYTGFGGPARGSKVWPCASGNGDFDFQAAVGRTAAVGDAAGCRASP